MLSQCPEELNSVAAMGSYWSLLRLACPGAGEDDHCGARRQLLRRDHTMWRAKAGDDVSLPVRRG